MSVPKPRRLSRDTREQFKQDFEQPQSEPEPDSKPKPDKEPKKGASKR